MTVIIGGIILCLVIFGPIMLVMLGERGGRK